MTSTYWFYVIFLICSHDFHVSRTEMRYNARDNNIETSMHIFIDDLEQALANYSPETLGIGTGKEHSSVDSLILLYIKKHFEVISAGDHLIPVYLGKEMTGDLSAIWIHLFYPWNGKGDLKIVNTILLETYDDQKNIVEYSDDRTDQSALTYAHKTSFIISR